MTATPDAEIVESAAGPGVESSEIASELGISPRTAKNHVSKTMWLAIGAVLVLLVVALRARLQWGGPFPGDRYAALHYSGWRWEDGWVQKYTTPFLVLGTPEGAIPILLLSTWALWRRRMRREAVAVVIAAVVIPLITLAKLVSGPTPLWSQMHFGGTNFPSGHAAFATAVIGYLGVMAYRHRQPEIVAMAALVIIGMGPALVLSGTHLVSDVIGGYLLGAAWLIFTMVWVTSGER